ncbi:MAG: hypothetical protein KAS05_01965 [Candidatus Omnitrophica bacterium]|nr:hypothetical protein [Candidatus Omnitrophota bacterium]
MIHFEFKPSFKKSLNSLPKKDKNAIKESCAQLIEVLSGKSLLRKGLGLKQLRKDWWEIRKGLKQRILFRWRNNEIDFVLAGNHDQIKRFLKKI